MVEVAIWLFELLQWVKLIYFTAGWNRTCSNVLTAT